MGGKPNLGSHLSIYILFWVSVHMMCAYAFHLITPLTLQLVYSYSWSWGPLGLVF